MLPASLQTPAAIVLVAGGLLSCFAGYRVFRVVLGIYGFILGALLASSFMGAEQTLWMIVAALAGGLAGSVILILAYFVGVALIGAGVGALTANVAWAAFGREPGMWAVILLAIAGALAALALQRYVIISRPRSAERGRRSSAASRSQAIAWQIRRRRRTTSGWRIP